MSLSLSRFKALVIKRKKLGLSLIIALVINQQLSPSCTGHFMFDKLEAKVCNI